ncbi:TetR family transcriptional regulator [Wenjunlia tyrosinilytica]|uniref:TetR family transcriptional regulator n=1 Tax=Wenjunlia tyrosinilytica TaxID=1544741 RepID=A0A918DVB9_9ACTN|nr:TetR family transcriptional regulator [Wenjunlia tyrosinilytica]GGO83939.1 TetR family transcriptional regulator [Wenjunlia tyrosinilytica]
MDTSSRREDQQLAARRRREELLDAANRVVLRDGPEASMNAIAKEAGITKPILYRHFGDKGGLYQALAQRHTDALLDTLRAALDRPGTRRDRVAAGLDAYLSTIEASPQVYRFLMHPSDEPAEGDRSFETSRHAVPMLRRLGEELAHVMAERIDLGPGGERTARAWGHGVVGMMYAAGDWWLAEEHCSRAELVEELTDLLWGRLTVTPDRRRDRAESA